MATLYINTVYDIHEAVIDMVFNSKFKVVHDTSQFWFN